MEGGPDVTDQDRSKSLEERRKTGSKFCTEITELARSFSTRKRPTKKRPANDAGAPAIRGFGRGRGRGRGTRGRGGGFVGSTELSARAQNISTNGDDEENNEAEQLTAKDDLREKRFEMIAQQGAFNGIDLSRIPGLADAIDQGMSTGKTEKHKEIVKLDPEKEKEGQFVEVVHGAMLNVVLEVLKINMFDDSSPVSRPPLIEE